MKSTGINSWLKIASNVGLIGGLVLVAVQIQQHRDLTRLQMRLDFIASFQQMELGMLGEEPSVSWSKSIRDPCSFSISVRRGISELFSSPYCARTQPAV